MQSEAVIANSVCWWGSLEPLVGDSQLSVPGRKQDQFLWGKQASPPRRCSVPSLHLTLLSLVRAWIHLSQSNWQRNKCALALNVLVYLSIKHDNKYMLDPNKSSWSGWHLENVQSAMWAELWSFRSDFFLLVVETVVKTAPNWGALPHCCRGVSAPVSALNIWIFFWRCSECREPE